MPAQDRPTVPVSSTGAVQRGHESGQNPDDMPPGELLIYYGPRPGFSFTHLRWRLRGDIVDAVSDPRFTRREHGNRRCTALNSRRMKRPVVTGGRSI